MTTKTTLLLFRCRNVIEQNDNAMDDHGHGTAMAGLIAAVILSILLGIFSINDLAALS